MPFFLQKLAEAVLLPASAACLLLAAGLVVSRWRRGLGVALSCAGLALLWAFATPAVAERLAGRLERAYPVPPPTLHAEVAVALCGTVDLARSTPERIEFYDHPERIIEGAKLVKEGRAQTLVITGGSGDPLYPETREADYLARFARDYGVPPEAILVER
ncbi:MAG: YdcF family protein, partial [Deltaproteobacteria bacterium]|nr:YdcF family protein [Deltaproteobacteria bacterium]